MTENDERIENLKKLLESGDLDQETYDEILKRWEGETGVSPDDSEDHEEEHKEEHRERKRSSKVKVSGAGTLSDVYTHEFSGSGSVHVEGYLDAESINISGSGHIDGDVISSEYMHVSGTAKVNGKVTGNSISSSGSLRAESMKGGSVESSGSLKIARELIADNIDVSGGINADSITAKVIKSSGTISSNTMIGDEIFISGKIKSSHVKSKRFEMDLIGSSSSIGKLESEIIEIKREGRRFFTGSIDIDEIQCKRAQIEGVKAKSIKGDELIIGEGCDIDYAEAKTIKIRDGARVREKKEL